MQRGDAGNSARVLTKLTGSRVMTVFLLDSVGVLSRIIGIRATSKMKITL